jgi:hypothetical protein
MADLTRHVKYQYNVCWGKFWGVNHEARYIGRRFSRTSFPFRLRAIKIQFRIGQPGSNGCDGHERFERRHGGFRRNGSFRRHSLGRRGRNNGFGHRWRWRDDRVRNHGRFDRHWNHELFHELRDDGCFDDGCFDEYRNRGLFDELRNNRRFDGYWNDGLIHFQLGRNNAHLRCELGPRHG